MRRLPKFVKLIFATVMTLGMYTGVAYGGDGTPPEITVQPESQRNVYGANVEFGITATGENLKYQWQYKPRIKGGTWTNSTDSGATTNKLKLVANDQNEYLYRCLVSDDTYSGDKAIMSNAASLYVLDDQIFEIKYVSETPTAPVITTQPLSQMLSVGEKATFTVEATGTDLTYQWQYKSSLPNSAWTNLTRNDGTGFDTNTFTTTTLTGSQDHYQYRCLVRSTNYYYGDEYAKESDSAFLQVTSKGYIDIQYINEEYEIVEQPVSQSVYAGATVKFRVDTTGSTNLTYRWLYKAPGTNTSWTEVPDSMGKGAKTAELTISPVKEEYENYQFRCSVGGEYYKYEEAKLSSVATLLLLSETQIVDVQFDNSKLMITEWNVSGDAGLEITLPVRGTGLNITVDWGDGTGTENFTTEYPTHTYAKAGVYSIAVAGNCPEWGYMTDRIVTDPSDENYQAYLKCKTSLEYIIGLKQWGSINATRYSFSNCKNLTYVSGDATADTFTNVTNMMYLFNNCTNLKTIDLSNFNTSNVKNMWGMFMNCTSVENLDVSTFDTSNVETMLGMFANCQKLKSLNLKNFNTSKVTGMYNMFAGCKELKELDLSSFDTSKVTTMIWMFSGCEKLQKIDMSSFDTSNVTTMRAMFNGCKSLQNIDLSNFNTSKVTNMESMFWDCSSLKEIDVSGFDTSKVTRMNGMFSKCTGLTKLDLSNFNTDNVTDMELMFNECTNLKELNVKSFNTSNVTDMRSMFKYCSSLETLDISNFDTRKAIRKINSEGVLDEGLELFMNTSSLKSLLIGENFVITEGNEKVFENCNALTAVITISETPVENQFRGKLPSTATLYVPNGSEDAYRTTLSGDTSLDQIKPIIEPIGSKNMTIQTGSEYIEQGCTVAGFTEAESKFYTDYGYELTQSGTVDTENEGEYQIKYELKNNGEEFSSTTRNVSVADKTKFMITEWNVSGDAGLTITLPVSGTGLNITVDWGDGAVETITTEFPTHTYVKAGVYEIAVMGDCPEWGYSTSNTPTEKYSTYNNYLINVRQFGELNATRYGFAYCSNLKEVSGENLVAEKTFEHVTSMAYMFYKCTSLENIDASNFDSSRVESMWSMFDGCSNLRELDLSAMRTPKLTNMYNMFFGCTKLEKLDISNFDTSKVKQMIGIFNNCQSLKELDLSNFDTSNAITMSYMFANCKSLKTLDISNFETPNIEGMYSMFGGCSELESLIIGNMSNTKASDMRYVFNGCQKLKELDLSGFGTPNATNMQGMFQGCKALVNLDLSNFNTSKVTNFNAMFKDCASLQSLNVNSFNTSNATDMSNMFYGCSKLESIDVSIFNTSKVTNMNAMFNFCSALNELDLSNFNTSNVTNMGTMFGVCTSLEKINLSNWDTRKVTNMQYMFSNCTSLKELDLSSFKTDSLTGTLAMFSHTKNIETIDLSQLDTRNVTNMSNMFMNTSKLKSILISENFVVTGQTGVNIFWGSSIKSVITTSTTPVANQFKGQLPTGTSLYVPNGCEDAYKEILSGDTDASKIKPIIEPIGEKEVGVLLGTSYEEQNFTVAGFGVEEAEYYMAYGYNVEVSGDVNTNENGTYKVEYILTRTYKETDGTQKEERHVATRIVKVYDAPVVNLYENNAPYSGDWTNQNIVAIMNILSSKTTWIAIRVENGDWSIEPTYAKIEKSGDQMIATFNTSLNGKVYFKEVDVAGNATTYESEPSIIKIDKENPVIEEIKAETIDGVIKLKASIKEELSGIEYYAVVASGEEVTWKKYEQADSKIEETLLASGKYQLWSKDRAQNEASGEIIAKKDVEPPKGSIDIVATNIISGDKYTNQDAVLININVTDNQTEQERIMYAIYNEEDYKEVKAGTKEIEWKQYTPTVTWVLKEPQGINIIYAVFKDRAGNISMSQGILETP